MRNRIGEMKLLSLFPGEEVTMSSEANYYGTRGTLYLTNRRLAFVYEKRGFVFRSKGTPVNLLLEAISEIAIIGSGPFKKISVHTQKDKITGLPRYEFKVRSPDSWKIKIECACLEAVKVIIKKCSNCGAILESYLSECPVCGEKTV